MRERASERESVHAQCKAQSRDRVKSGIRPDMPHLDFAYMALKKKFTSVAHHQKQIDCRICCGNSFYKWPNEAGRKGVIFNWTMNASRSRTIKQLAKAIWLMCSRAQTRALSIGYITWSQNWCLAKWIFSLSLCPLVCPKMIPCLPLQPRGFGGLCVYMGALAAQRVLPCPQRSPHLTALRNHTQHSTFDLLWPLEMFDFFCPLF